MTEQKIKNDAESAELKTQLDITTAGQELQAGKAIQPYRLAVMFKLADKIVGQIVNIPDWVVSYDDMEFILETILSAVHKAKGAE